MCKATKYQLSKLQCSVCGLGILVTEGRLVDVAVGVADLEGGGALQRVRVAGEKANPSLDAGGTRAPGFVFRPPARRRPWADEF